MSLVSVLRVCVIGTCIESMHHWYLYREYVSLVSVERACVI